MLMPTLNEHACKYIGASAQVITWIQEGICIPFKSFPHRVTGTNLVYGTQHKQFVTNEIKCVLQEMKLNVYYKRRQFVKRQ